MEKLFSMALNIQIKILIISGDMDVGGIQNQLMHLLRNSDKERFQIDFTSTMQGAFYREEIETLGGKFLLIPQMRMRNPLPYCKAIYRIMKDSQYDIVHTHELFHSGIVLTIARLAGVSIRIVHAHNWEDRDDPQKPRGIVRTIYNSVMRMAICRFSTAQVACSTWAAKFLYGKKVAASSTCHLIYNSVDTEKFLDYYDQIETGEFCDNGWSNVLHVGRFTPVKNQIFLIRIAEELKKRNQNIRILCAGTGEESYVRQLSDIINQRGLEDYIKFIGVRKDINVLMRKANAFILPSKFEGMPLVLIEAQSTGLPCLVADTFSPEVDFELGLIQWMKLEQGISAWTDVLEIAVQKKRAPKVAVEQMIQKKNFDSKMFAKRIMELYSQEYQKRCESRK